MLCWPTPDICSQNLFYSELPSSLKISELTRHMQHWKIPWNVLFWTCLPQNLTNSLMKLCTLHFSFLLIYFFITKNIKDVFEVLNKVLYKWNVHCCRIITDYECLICVNSNSVSSQELKCVLSKADCVMREESNILGNIPVWMSRKIIDIQHSITAPGLRFESCLIESHISPPWWAGESCRSSGCSATPASCR